MVVFVGIILLERSGFLLGTDRDGVVTPKLDDNWQYLLVVGVLFVLFVSIYVVQCGLTGVEACASGSSAAQ